MAEAQQDKNGSKKDPNEDFILAGFDSEWFEGIGEDVGEQRERVMFGHRTLDIVRTESVPTVKAKRPHNMLKVWYRVDGGPDDGKEVGELYAGSRESPPRMQKRLKALLIAAQVKPEGSKGFHPKKQLVGRRIDATITWTTADAGDVDEEGEPKLWVNERVSFERPVGATEIGAKKIPVASIDPERLSARAYAYAKKKGWITGEAGDGDEAPWEGKDEADDEGDGEGKPAVDGEQPGKIKWIDEKEVKPEVHNFRAAYKMGVPNAPKIYEMLVKNQFNPDGPIDVAKISNPDIKKGYEAFLVKEKEGEKKEGGLDPDLLGSGGSNGATAEKTGTRSKKK